MASLERHLENELVTLLQANTTLQGVSGLTIQRWGGDVSLPMVVVHAKMIGNLPVRNLYLPTFSVSVAGFVAYHEDEDNSEAPTIQRGIIETLSDSNLVTDINAAGNVHVYPNSFVITNGTNEITEARNWRVGLEVECRATYP